MNATPRLDDLISAIESSTDDPLTRLSEAVTLGQHLDELADHLIGHFVDRARRSGASWTTIGENMGVTKQAAQKRFVPNEPATAETGLRVFERYTDGARAVIVASQEEARRAGHTQILTGHVLLALLHDQGIAGLVDADSLRAAVADAVGTGDADLVGHIPFSAGAKKALELGHREALRLGSERIRPEHLLLGLLSTPEEPALVAVAQHDLTRDAVEKALRDRVE
ncbi:Clp protease N-terminal domain-containing protein [Actinokineospora enzanensis]|uniref:Clp protease N-terminal domain-containing protein n=1 Tax=Actinokineospora enzanensis TaxID=155975 RepID=UPI00035F06EF|nr:Clp protease N-terminal domain-containing protein [Actinokineospora enzanensis]